MQQNKLLQTIQHINSINNPLFREKLIMLCLQFVKENRIEYPIKTLTEQLPFQFEQLLQEYINDLNYEDLFQLSKAFDLFTQKTMERILERNMYIKFEIHLLKSIALQYKAQQNYHVAVKTMRYVLELEQKLDPKDPLSIVSNRMSLVTILSTAGQHTQALSELNQIQHFIHQTQDQKQFLKLLCIMHYNYGVEWEHQGQLFQAQINFHSALEIAKNNKYEDLQSIIEQAIANIKKQKQ